MLVARCARRGRPSRRAPARSPGARAPGRGAARAGPRRRRPGSRRATAAAACSGEPRLADSARPGQRQQPHVLPREQRRELVELPLAAEKRRRRNGQVRAGRGVFSGGNSPVAELVDALGRGRSFSRCSPRSRRTRTSRRRAASAPSCAETSTWPAVAGGHHPRGAVHVEAGVHLRRSRAARRCACPIRTRIGSRSQACARAPTRAAAAACSARRAGREGEVEAVALHLHLDAAVRRERLAQQAPMRRRAPHVTPRPSSWSMRVEPSMSVKRKGDRAARELRHPNSRKPTTARRKRLARPLCRA